MASMNQLNKGSLSRTHYSWGRKLIRTSQRAACFVRVYNLLNGCFKGTLAEYPKPLIQYLRLV